jgi:hypothetical protein
MKDQVAAYLARYAEPEIACAETISRRYRQVLVIPMFDERAEALSVLLPDAACDLLVICVINTPTQAAGSNAHRRSRELLVQLGASRGRTASLVEYRPGVDLLLIDRVSDALVPQRQGVGLARKIGADLALALIDRALVHHRRIYCTDADVVLPASYFQLPLDDPAAAWCFPFEHASRDQVMHQRGQCYELQLRYYRDGLARAGSRYAFHSIGSALCVDADSYARVRGFPRRAAGEDFYLLNKLAKLGPVRTPSCPPIRIEARHSTRVPFGTGRALANMSDDPDRVESFHPDLFAQLATALARLTEPIFTPGSDPVDQILQRMGANEKLARIDVQNRSDANRQRAVLDWFDGLRSLQFLHLMRDAGWPDRPLLASVRKILSLRGADATALNCALREREAGVTGIADPGFQPS